MADKNSNEAASSSGPASETSDSCIELNIKTLDSQVHTFRVQRNMPIPLFKEQIAIAVGVPAVQQRLIFRGKVLKDDHLLSDYNVEDGHSLHLVVRQPVQSQSPAGAGSASRNADQPGSGPAAGGSRNRGGQVSHSVVLGTFNIGDQVESIVPDISRIIGAVLNSVGLGNLSAANEGGRNQPLNMTDNAPDQGAQGDERDGSQATGGGRGETENQVPPGPTPLNLTFQSLPQSFQLLSGATAVPSQPMVIPDSLTTLSEFISQMELVLSVYGNHSRPTLSTTRRSIQPSDNSSSQSRGIPTPESLSSVMLRAQQILGHSGTALSHVAGRLEGQSGVTDPILRNQIQAEAVHLGVAMQHLGSLLLELGRTIQMLRMGPSPTDSVVNSGPAVYISRHGPNPLMVQPSPFQTSSLFGASSAAPVHMSAASPGQVNPLDISRNVNIHIHAGTAVAPGFSLAGLRAAGEVSTPETQNSEQANTTATSSGERRDSGPMRLLPIQTVVAAVPAHPAEATNNVLSLFYPLHARPQQTAIPQQATVNPSVPAEEPSTTFVGGAGSLLGTGSSQELPRSAVLPTVPPQVQMHVRGVDCDPSSGSHLGGSTLTTSDATHSARRPQVSEVTDGTEATLKPENSEHGLQSCATTTEHMKLPVENNLDSTERRMNSIIGTSTHCPEECTCNSSTDTIHEKSCSEEEKNISAPTSNEAQVSHSDKAVPLGLGLGALQPLPSKKKHKPVKQQPVNPTSSNLSQEAVSRGQSILQSLVSQGRSGIERADANGLSMQSPSLVGQVLGNMSSEQGAGRGQVDVTNMMSQVLNDPTFNNLLSGISTQAGNVSPDLFRNVLGQFASTPSVRNAFEQVAQQVEDQDVEQMLSGLGTGQGIDFSRMVQQMLPVVTKALGGISSAPLHSISTDQTSAEGQPRVMENGPDKSQIDMEDAARQIESHSSPGGVFRAMAHNAHRYSGMEADDSGLIDDLCSDDGLADEFMQMLYRNLQQRLDSEGRSEDGS